MTETRFPDDGVLAAPLLLTLGDRGSMTAALLSSGVRELLSADKLAALIRGGGWTDFALEALDAVRFLVASPPSRLPPSMDERADPGTSLPESEAMLGRRRCAVFLAYSESNMPGPTDFL